MKPESRRRQDYFLFSPVQVHRWTPKGHKINEGYVMCVKEHPDGKGRFLLLVSYTVIKRGGFGGPYEKEYRQRFSWDPQKNHYPRVFESTSTMRIEPDYARFSPVIFPRARGAEKVV